MYPFPKYSGNLRAADITSQGNNIPRIICRMSSRDKMIQGRPQAVDIGAHIQGDQMLAAGLGG